MVLISIVVPLYALASATILSLAQAWVLASTRWLAWRYAVAGFAGTALLVAPILFFSGSQASSPRPIATLPGPVLSFRLLWFLRCSGLQLGVGCFRPQRMSGYSRGRGRCFRLMWRYWPCSGPWNSSSWASSS